MDQEFSLVKLENLVVDRKLDSKFDVSDISAESLLFQSGYLTIAEEVEEHAMTFYRLEYPNYEVRQSLNEGLLNHLGVTSKRVSDTGHEFCALLKANEFEKFGKQMHVFLAGIPYPWHTSVGHYKSWYASMLYACFNTIDVDLRVEEVSSHGRSDMVVFLGGQVFVMEFKVIEDKSAVDAAMVKYTATEVTTFTCSVWSSEKWKEHF